MDNFSKKKSTNRFLPIDENEMSSTGNVAKAIEPIIALHLTKRKHHGENSSQYLSTDTINLHCETYKNKSGKRIISSNTINSIEFADKTSGVY